MLREAERTARVNRKEQAMRIVEMATAGFASVAAQVVILAAVLV